MFAEVLVLMVLVLTLFSLIGLHAFKGSFSQSINTSLWIEIIYFAAICILTECVLRYDPNATNLSFNDWNSNPS